jgi:hypothetical protein
MQTSVQTGLQSLHGCKSCGRLRVALNCVILLGAQNGHVLVHKRQYTLPVGRNGWTKIQHKRLHKPHHNLISDAKVMGVPVATLNCVIYISKNGQSSLTHLQLDDFTNEGHHRDQHVLPNRLIPGLQGTANGKCSNWDFSLKVFVIMHFYQASLFTPGGRLDHSTRAFSPIHWNPRFFRKWGLTSTFLGVGGPLLGLSRTQTHAKQTRTRTHTHIRRTNTYLALTCMCTYTLHVILCTLHAFTGTKLHENQPATTISSPSSDLCLDL